MRGSADGPVAPPRVADPASLARETRMRPVDISVIRALYKPGCLGPAMGAVGLLVAVLFGMIGMASIAANPVQGIIGLVAASFGGVVFGRAWIADRRWRELERRTIHRRPAAAGDSVAHRYVDDQASAGDPITIAVRTFLDDPAGLRYLDIEGTGSMRLHFALLSSDPTVLRGQATGLSRLDPNDHPGLDAESGLFVLGWAGPAPPSREDFAAEWSLPIDLAGLGAIILSTARIYSVEPTTLRARFGGTPSVSYAAEPVEPNVLRRQKDKTADAAPDRPNLRAVLPRWSRRRALRWLPFSVALVAVVAGKARIEEFVRWLPPWLPSGALGIVILGTGVRFLLRFFKTSDPFSVTGSDGRTDYEAHIWWGIVGAVAVVVGIGFLVYAVGEFD